MLSWIFIVLVHWNNSLRIDMSPHSDTLSWFWSNQSLLFSYCCMLSGEATNINFIVFALTRSGLKPTIYCTGGEHANHYTTDSVMLYKNQIFNNKKKQWSNASLLSIKFFKSSPLIMNFLGKKKSFHYNQTAV